LSEGGNAVVILIPHKNTNVKKKSQVPIQKFRPIEREKREREKREREEREREKEE
jgi:hypothetical protein